MAQFSKSIVVASAGEVSISPGSEISFTVIWGTTIVGQNISPFRWSRIWPAIQSAGDAAAHQSVIIVSEGSEWDLGTPTLTPMAVTLRGDGDSDAPVVANTQVMASQDDTF